MSYAFAKGLADSLARYLAHPGPSGLCPICFADIAGRFSGDLVGHLPHLRVECHALFDSCIVAITQSRTIEEIARLQSDLMKNHSQCGMHNAPDDFSYPLDPALYLRALFDTAGSIIVTTAQFGDSSLTARAERVGKSFSDKLGRWPVRLEQLFPYGADTAVDALLAYCELYISPGPMDTLSCLLIAARSAVLPILCSDRFRARLADIVIKMIDPVASGIGTNPSWPVVHQPLFPSVCQFVRTVITGPGALPQDRTELFAGHESALLAVLGSMIQRLDDGDPLFSAFSSWCADIAYRHNLALPRRVFSWLRDGGDLPEHETRGAPVVYEFLNRRMSSRLCWGPGCTQSSITIEDGKPFPACARCKVPRYCSRACQRADWKHGDAPVPHMRVCIALEKVGAHICHRVSPEQFAESYAQVEPLFDETDKAAIAAYAIFWMNF